MTKISISLKQIISNQAVLYKVDRCLARYSPRLNRPTQLADQNIRISAICRPKLALLGPKNADFGPKIQFFWYHVTPIFGLRWTQLNGIITCPHHEVTLDNFGFLVGSHLTAWWAVIRPHMAKMVLLGAKNPVFWPEINFLETLSNIFDTIMAGHEKHNFFVLIQSQGGPRGGC